MKQVKLYMNLIKVFTLICIVSSILPLYVLIKIDLVYKEFTGPELSIFTVIVFGILFISGLIGMNIISNIEVKSNE